MRNDNDVEDVEKITKTVKTLAETCKLFLACTWLGNFLVAEKHEKRDTHHNEVTGDLFIAETFKIATTAIRAVHTISGKCLGMMGASPEGEDDNNSKS